MSQSTKYHQQNIFDSTGLLPGRRLASAIVHLLLLVLVVILTDISGAHADGLFDFQMKLAEKGNAEAQYKIGDMYETGFGVKKDMAKAEEWTNKAAKQGHETANYKLLYWDMKKNGLTAGNKPKFEQLQARAKADDGYAQYFLGKTYADGAGVPKDSEIALDWFNKATFIGIVEAEREAVAVRDEAQRAQLAKRRAEQKRAEEQRAQQEAERLKNEAEQQAAAKKVEDERKARLAEAKRKQAEAAANLEKAAAEKEAAKLAAARAAEQRENEAKRQAILKQREEREAERKAEFESDPCSGKSARFLSTCR